MKGFCIAGAMVLTIAVAPGVAQEPDPDSLVALFIEHGKGADGWKPYDAFEGCPELEPWQREAFRLLINADLTRRRRSELVLALISPLKACGDAELEAWYFGEMERHAALGIDYLYPYWMGIREADNPRVRAKLYQWLADENLDPGFRDVAAAEYYLKFPPGGMLDMLLVHHEEGVVPSDWANLKLRQFVRSDAATTLAGMGRLVRGQPERFLGDPSFQLFVTTNVLHFAPPDVRARFLSDVRAAMAAAPGLSSQLREHLLHLLAQVADMG